MDALSIETREPKIIKLIVPSISRHFRTMESLY